MIGMDFAVPIRSTPFCALLLRSEAPSQPSWLTSIESHYYFQDLPEPKYLRLLANAEHSTVLNGISNPHFIFSLRSLFIATIKGNYDVTSVLI